MSDVAQRAGVSGATVSHVLNGTRHVSAHTRLRVEEAIRETGYRHNSLARALAAGRTSTIGMCVPILTNPYIADLVNAIESAAGSAGYTLIIGDSQDDPDREMRAVTTFLERRVDGILIAPGKDSADSTIPVVLQTETPLVLIDRQVPGVHCDQVFAENINSARGLTEHLLDHGYRDIAVLCGTPGIRSTDERYQGVTEALYARGFAADPELTPVANANAIEAAERMSEILHSGRMPQAVITLNNAMTIGVMRAIRDHGLRVPNDIALGAFDDFEWADLFEPRLTAVAQDVGTMGRIAMQRLVQRIDGSARAPESIALPTELRVRTSCGCFEH